MSKLRHHNEWQSLIEISGPFLSMPVLYEVFPQELDAFASEDRKDLALAYDAWQMSLERRRLDPAMQTAWIEYVLSRLLDLQDDVLRTGQGIPSGLEVRIPEHGETLRPRYVLVNPAGRDDAGKPRLLVTVYPSSQHLEGPTAGSAWKASPATRMLELLRSVGESSGVVLGLVTNGERWMLVHAPPRETSAYVTWRADFWLEEPLTLRAFRSLLGRRRFFEVRTEHSLEAMLRKSAEDQQEVTDRLGLQVRRAVEVLVRTLDTADSESGRCLLAEVPESRLYEAALTVMMRLVFLFCAEERDMLPLQDLFYELNYAVSRLSAQLRESADNEGEQVLEHRYDAWCRLLATFRAVHGGVSHDRLRLPGYGGGLFDPDRFPFLEGREDHTSWRDVVANPLPVDNRTALHLLEALQFLEVSGAAGGSERRRLSFRALDVEQIGHVYEGLLDHVAARADSVILCLKGAKGRDLEIPLPQVEERRASGRLVEDLSKETGRSASAIQNALTDALAMTEAGAAGGRELRKKLRVGLDPARVERIRNLCGHDRALYDRLLPFAQLLRDDSFGYPLVILPGSVYVTRGADRRSTGTHYTPRSLTEPVVRYTLEPLVFEGPAEGWDPEQWRLRSAKDLLSLKVCDMAMGSGAFLVQACRYLAERLVEAWEAAEKAHPGSPRITPEGIVSTGAPTEELIPLDADERLLFAQRIVAERCLYGVDKNPMAVEMAKLSLWLTTMQKNRPFSFLNHALKCGDSLLGLTSPEQVRHFHLDPERGKALHMTLFDFTKDCLPALERALALRKRLEGFEVRDIRDVEEQERLHHQAELELAMLHVVGDLIVGAALTTAGKSNEALDAKLDSLAPMVADMLDPRNTEDERLSKMETLQKRAQGLLKGEGQERRPFHWVLEFPEVFAGERAAGFDAIVGNPPFLGGQKITGTLGTDYRDLLVEHLAGGRRGSADLCAYFFLRQEGRPDASVTGKKARSEAGRAPRFAGGHR